MNCGRSLHGILFRESITVSERNRHPDRFSPQHSGRGCARDDSFLQLPAQQYRCPAEIGPGVRVGNNRHSSYTSQCNLSLPNTTTQPTMEATTKDLRLNTRALLAATDRGEEVIITYRGQRRAKLVPWSEPDESASPGRPRNPAFGIWRDRPDDVDEQVRALRRGRDFP